MASLLFDQESGRYYIRFRYAGRNFKRSLKTKDEKRARGAVARVEETLSMLQSGRLQMPTGADPAIYLLSDGKQAQPAGRPTVLTIGELFDGYRAHRIPGAKELSTIKTEELHLQHLGRILKKSTVLQSLKASDLQAYIVRRLGEKCRARAIASETVRKEIATFRVVCNWGMRQGLLERPLPLLGLQYPKRDERPPYRTWHEISVIAARGGLSAKDEAELWESLYLTREETHEALTYAKNAARHRFIYPLLLFVAHTGVRISEALRVRIDDVDLESGKVLMREKKRSRVRATTFRQIDLTDMLRAVLRHWLNDHPGGLHLFAKQADLNRGRERGGVVPINKHVARKHFKLTFQHSKWSRLSGFHVFRHSFASNLASAGVDQRIIDDWMGHQTDEMRRRYRHLCPDSKQAAIAKLLPDAPLVACGN